MCGEEKVALGEKSSWNDKEFPSGLKATKLEKGDEHHDDFVIDWFIL